ncbi:MAG TPA: AarF/UbiB family protein [Lysobacter sp.]|nr:AarF/UbiB family protein [Lysobacter sp.]
MTVAESNLARSARILAFLGKYRSAGVFAGLDVEPGSGETAPPGDPEEFVRDLEALGPTFIKIGQALSTRADMVPEPYLHALERMQDDVVPVPFEQVRALAEEQLGMPLSAAFAEFDPQPLGSASLAQVHPARLHDGRAVAVKVQRPDIVGTIVQDLDILTSLARTADKVTDVGRRMQFVDWVHEFRRTLLAELDYRVEAGNLERFAEHLHDYPELHVPTPVWELTREKVLTMERIDGVKVLALTPAQRSAARTDALAAALMRGYLDQVFVHGEIHADPHPGNLLLTPDGQLALLDLGMVAHVPPKRRERLLKLLFAAVDGRGEDAAHETIVIGVRLADFDAERYQREVAQLVARYAAQSGRNSRSEGRLLLELVRTATACGLRTPPELSLLGKTLLNLEAVTRALDPELDLKDVVEEHLESVMAQRLRKSLSPSQLATELMELQSLAREAPRKLSDLLSLLAENRLQVRVRGLEESRLIENLQKIANRISVGIITGSLILASALLMRVETDNRLFGYPAIAMVFFALASLLGFTVVISALLRDRRAPPREDSRPD